MTMHDDRLSEREHAELRDLVLAGAQRTTAARPRRGAIAASVALVLVGGLVGGGVVAMTHLAERPVDRSAGRTSALPFGGDCAHAVTDAELVAIDDRIPLVLDEPRAGAADVLGGIECRWSWEGEMSIPPGSDVARTTVWIDAYPEEVWPEDEHRVDGPQLCVEFQMYPSLTSCATTGTIGGMRLVVGISGDPRHTSQDAADALYARVAERLAASPGEGRLVPGADWWVLPECTGLVEGVIADHAGGDEQPALAPVALALPDGMTNDLQHAAGAARTCGMEFTASERGVGTPHGITIDIIPGGAIAFESARERPGAWPVEVSGAAAAVLVDVPSSHGGGAPQTPVLMATDGVNMLVLTPTASLGDPVLLAALAASVLGLL
ncbi:hypothetical protein [Microbacterium sp. No. 7]|uniref:hypothetical protein n=1 Tax=Microbacterium sp. No. 7 TaxID=1714373 RepID=UPI0006D2B3D9|nr:hypothetical protein [Microbacterium sp. No. 7]ALJ21137.1 hypothetical protein AOA12_15000 [Microbacterium sp. No. 7]